MPRTIAALLIITTVVCVNLAIIMRIVRVTSPNEYHVLFLAAAVVALVGGFAAAAVNRTTSSRLPIRSLVIEAVLIAYLVAFTLKLRWIEGPSWFNPEIPLIPLENFLAWLRPPPPPGYIRWKSEWDVVGRSSTSFT